GEEHRERRSRAERALARDGAPEPLDDASHDVQTEPEPSVLARRYAALEPLEDVRKPIGVDPHSVIAHREPGVAVAKIETHVDGRAGAELDGVREQIRDDLRETRSVPRSHDLAGDADADRRARSGRFATEPIDHLTNERGEIHGLSIDDESIRF